MSGASDHDLEAFEGALDEFIKLDDRGGIIVGAVIAVERRVENMTGIDGAVTHRLDYFFTHNATAAQTYGLAHWLRETLVHGIGDEPDDS